jgi:TIR domain
MAMKGFVSYSHEDYRLFDGFVAHLATIRRAFDLEVWTDHAIHAGSEWNAEIASAIRLSDVFVLLISPDFIGSDYVYEKEIPAIQAQRRAGGGLILPVVLKRCLWQMIAAALQAVPTEKGRVRPVSDWRPWDNGYDRAREQMMASIESHFGITPKKITW